jgi:fructose 1,6-bisphosphate aldolase/phosphatase
MDYLRRHGPFEPHRLALDEMEYTTMPEVADRLKDRWEPTDVSVPTITGERTVKASADDVE